MSSAEPDGTNHILSWPTSEVEHGLARVILRHERLELRILRRAANERRLGFFSRSERPSNWHRIPVGAHTSRISPPVKPSNDPRTFLLTTCHVRSQRWAQHFDLLIRPRRTSEQVLVLHTQATMHLCTTSRDTQ